MKKIILSLALVSAVALTSCKNETAKKEVENAVEEVKAVTEEVTTAVKNAFTPDYKVEATSVVEWVGSKPTGKHNGTINVTEGGVKVENGNLTSGEFVIDMNSITVLDLPADKGKGNLEAHLKGTEKEEEADHFFNVKKYPTSKFVLKSFDGTTMKGDLTVKEVTKEVSFPAVVTVTDSEVTITSKSFKINRVDFGVNYGSKSVFDNLKDKFINDEIELVVKVTAKK